MVDSELLIKFGLDPYRTTDGRPRHESSFASQSQAAHKATNVVPPQSK